MGCPLRLIFLGTRDFALPSLRALLEQGYQIVGIVTQPDRPQGRDREVVACAAKQLGQQYDLAVFQPEDINQPDAIDYLRRLQPDLLVLVAYGQILSEEVLRLARHGGINLHGSLLPRYRGASPVAWAIYHGEAETGVTVIQMVPRVDAGPVLARSVTRIGEEETAGELEARLAELGAPLVCSVVDRIASSDIQPLAQVVGQATSARRLRKEDGLIDWSRTALQVCNQVRAMQPWPSAYTHLQRQNVGRDLRLIVQQVKEGPAVADLQPPGTVIGVLSDALQVQTGRGTTVRVRQVQPAGGRSMNATEFVNGYRVTAGDCLGSTSTAASPPESS